MILIQKNNQDFKIFQVQLELFKNVTIANGKNL